MWGDSSVVLSRVPFEPEMLRLQRISLHNRATFSAAPSALLRLLETPSRFALVGAVNTSIDVAVFWVLTGLAQVPPLPANAVSYSLAAVNGFVLNRHLTFRHRKMRHGSGAQLMAYVLVRLTCLALSTVVLAAALPFMSPMLAKLVSIAVTFVAAYLLSSRVAFRS
jgi:putative flippase GtrA